MRTLLGSLLLTGINTLRPRPNGRHFADNTFKRIFLNENVGISIKISLKFVPKGPINNIPALVQVMAWRRQGDKPLTAPMVVILLTHICVTRPQWVNLNPSMESNYTHYKHRFNQKWQLRVCKWNFRVCKMPLLMKISMKMKELGWF